MNDTPQPDNLQNEKSLGNRILGYSLAASVVINLGWVFWVAHSDIFGSAANIAQLHEKPIKIFKPIPVKPKPKPPKPIPPPPPPKQRPQPKIKPLKPIKPIVRPPRPVPHPMPAPSRPAPATHLNVASSNRSASNFSVPTGPPQDTGKPVEQSTQPPPVVEHHDDPPPVVEHHDDPPPVVEHHDPPPVVEHHDPPSRPKIEDRDVPEVIGSFGDINLPQVDPGTLTVTSITATWEVDENGHPSNIHLSPKSSGNFDVDAAIIDGIRKFRFKPAAHNGQPEAAEATHTFELG